MCKGEKKQVGHKMCKGEKKQVGHKMCKGEKKQVGHIKYFGAEYLKTRKKLGTYREGVM